MLLQPLDQAFAASRARPVHQDATAFVRRCQKSEVRNQKLSFILKWYSCPVRILLLVALDDLDLELLLVAVVGHSMRAVGRI